MPARRASLPTLAFRQQLSLPLSLSLIVHEGRRNGKGDAMQRGASFSASQPSALICLSDACSPCCAFAPSGNTEPLPSCSRNRLIWVSKRFLGASSTCATCGSQCSGSASCQSVSQYPPSESQPENTAVTTREYPPASRHKYRK